MKSTLKKIFFALTVIATVMTIVAFVKPDLVSGIFDRQSQLEAADQLFEDQLFSEAKDVYTGVLKRSPDNSHARRRISLCRDEMMGQDLTHVADQRFEEGKFDLALKKYNQAIGLSAHPSHARQQKELCIQHLRKNDQIYWGGKMSPIEGYSIDIYSLRAGANHKEIVTRLENFLLKEGFPQKFLHKKELSRYQMEERLQNVKGEGIQVRYHEEFEREAAKVLIGVLLDSGLDIKVSAAPLVGENDKTDFTLSVVLLYDDRLES